jgi:hypothetical protein
VVAEHFAEHELKRTIILVCISRSLGAFGR